MRDVSNPRTTFLFGFYQLIVITWKSRSLAIGSAAFLDIAPFHTLEHSVEARWHWCVGAMPSLLCSP